MFYESRRTSTVLGRIHVPLLVCLSLALPWLVTCGRDNPTQSRSQIPTRVVVTPETADLSSAGQSVRLNAQVTGRHRPAGRGRFRHLAQQRFVDRDGER